MFGKYGEKIPPEVLQYLRKNPQTIINRLKNIPGYDKYFTEQFINSAEYLTQDANQRLKSFKKLTGCSVLVNTSFNVRGEPIVHTPKDAYNCFMLTDMDYLVLGNYVLDKKLSELLSYSEENVKRPIGLNPVQNLNKIV